MLPVIIEDLIAKATDSNTHHERRQHYIVTLRRIQVEVEKAIQKYEADKLGAKSKTYVKNKR